MDLRTTYKRNRKSTHKKIALTLLILAALSVQSGAKTQQASLFRELDPRESGIRFRNVLDETEELNYLVYEYFNIGGGVAFGDVNADGWLDIYVCYSGKYPPEERRNRLHINLQNGKFTDQLSPHARIPTGVRTRVIFLYIIALTL
jgi:hypothetical protein